MEKLISYFAKRSFVVNLICILILLLGALSVRELNRNLIPAWDFKRISITANLPGATSKQMEQFVTIPLEDALRSISGIEKLSSVSGPSRTSINLEIKNEHHKDIDDILDLARTKINNVKSTLPSDVESINIEKNKVTKTWFQAVGLLGFDIKNAKHLLWADSFKKRIKNKFPEIVQINSNIPEKRLYIEFKQDQISRYQLQMGQIVRKIKEELSFLPIGQITKDERKIFIDIENTMRQDKLENLIISANTTGSKILLKDIAKIEYRIPKEKVLSSINGITAKQLWMWQDVNVDSIDLKEKVALFYDEEQKLAPKGITIKMVGDGPAYIERQLNLLKNNGLSGILIVLLCLFLFLGFKTALLTSFSIPLAYMATMGMMYSMGIQIDLISVVALLLIIGILVDDAIVVAEQYTQYLEQGMPPLKAAVEAAKITMRPVTGSILTSIIAFVPILISNDSLSHILFAIPCVIITALLISWLESFFVLPNHLQHFIKNKNGEKAFINIEKLKGHYKKYLSKIIKWRYLILPLFSAFMVYSFHFASKNVPTKFDLRIGNEVIVIEAILKSSPGLEYTQKKLLPIIDELKKLDTERYSYLGTRVGRVYINNRSREGYRYAQISIRFSQTHPDIKSSKEYITKELDRILKGLPQTYKDQFEHLKSSTSIDGHDENKQHTLKLSVSPKTKDINVDALTQKFKKATASIPEIDDFFIDPFITQKVWRFVPNEQRLIERKITKINLASQLRQLKGPYKIDEFRYLGKNIIIMSSFGDWSNKTFKDLNQVEVLGAGSTRVKLKEIGTWKLMTTLASITREDSERVINYEISYDPEKIKKELFFTKVNDALKSNLQNDNSLSYELEDADKEAKKNKQSMSTMFLMAIGLIIFVMALTLNSIAQPLIIGMTIPFGMIGVIWSFYFHGVSIDVMAIVGIIGMAGVVVNDSLIMVDQHNRLLKEGLNRQNAIINAASLRLRAILLTSITTLGGVFPMAYGIGGESGFTRPLALSMGWGLLFATVLTLIVLPCMLLVLEDSKYFIDTKILVKFRNKEPVKEIIIDIDTQNNVEVPIEVIMQSTPEDDSNRIIN